MYKYIYIHIYVNICFVIEYVTEKSKQTFWSTLYIIYSIYIYIYIYIYTHTHIYIFYICDLERHTNEYINSFK